MTRAATARSQSSLTKPLGSSKLNGYLKRSESPLYSLAFLLPAMILFEVGSALRPSDTVAFRFMQEFFARLGTHARLLPALTVTGILLAWHIARGDSWKIRIATLWGMFLESWALSLPLLLLALSVARWQIYIHLIAPAGYWEGNALLSLGAGIYEEAVFRLIFMTIVMLIVGDLLKIPAFWANLLMVASSAVLFSLYHYLGPEPFRLQSFVFRAVAGIYFAVLFLTRGYGITAGCHVAYDVIIMSLQGLGPH